MTTIEISDELAAALQGMAAAEGLTLDAWLEQLVGENATPQTEEEERAELEWLRAAAKEGFDSIERGEYTELNSPEQLDNFMNQIYEEVKQNLAAGRRIGG
jgi:predicted transcriptional regulator